jgi:hypothetical protein
MKTTVRLVVLGMLMALYTSALAQDTLRLSNGDLLHGEIKSLNKSVVTIETGYSDADFKVEWEDVVEISSPRKFTIFLSSREKLFASLRPGEEPGQITLVLDNGTQRVVSLKYIVIIDPIKDSFKNRFNASISSGLSIAKANNSKQFSTRATASYSTPHWKLAASFNNTHTEQDAVEPIKRTDASLNYTYFLYRNWFVAYTYDYLSNTEQLIDLRGTHTLAMGNMIVRNNRMYLSGSAGLTFNREKYLNELEALQTTEGFFGAELNAYDIGDLSLLTKVSYYPSLSQAGRHRVNFSADVKYEFPLDFFIKFGYTLNYDSKPPNAGPEQDYVFQTTLGWEF